MNEASLSILLVTAASLGFVHTLTGPDHYVPFVAMSRIGRWSLSKTMWVTALCGVGHVMSSVVLGLLGIGLGLAVTRLEWFEGWRGNIAGWLLLGFGLAYFVWGVRQALRNRPHSHLHLHQGGVLHTHDHGHAGQHAHVHTDTERAASMTPWILFTIFVFGPCEPLIPLLMYPAAKLSAWGVVLVAIVFSVVTIGTMSAIVLATTLGLAKLPLRGMARWGHAVAGLVVTACGAAIQLGF
jgi:nickel/cobalt exporter